MNLNDPYERAQERVTALRLHLRKLQRDRQNLIVLGHYHPDHPTVKKYDEAIEQKKYELSLHEDNLSKFWR